MKKKTLTVMLLLVTCVLSVFLFVACGNEEENQVHEHVFNMWIPKAECLCKEATCTQKAKYYYSCKCGEKGTETFEYGEALGHKFTKDRC